MADAARLKPTFAPSDDAREAASLVEGPVTWLERAADRLNPIFVKETRQALKSKQFVIAFLLLVTAGWMITFFGVLAQGGNLDYTDAGRWLFSAYFVVLSAAVTIVVPFTAFRSLMAERDDATYEPLVITMLSPRQIVLGKLWTAMLQTFLYYSAIAPFVAFTALLQGFDFALVIFLLLIGLGTSLFVSTAAIAISSFVKSRVWQTIVSLALLAGLFFAFAGLWGISVAPFRIDWNDQWFWAGVLAWVAAGLSYVVVFQQVAVVNLAFEADNRSTGLRVICAGQTLLLWLIVFIVMGYVAASPSSSDYVPLVGIGGFLSLVHWMAFGFFFVSEEEDLSHRIVRGLPQSAVMRFLLAPFYPGGHRGLLLTTIASVAIILLVGLLTLPLGFGSFSARSPLPINLGLFLYGVIYLNAFAFIARRGLSLLAQRSADALADRLRGLAHPGQSDASLLRGIQRFTRVHASLSSVDSNDHRRAGRQVV
ncbi:MAG: hypothetical protein R3B90_08480 [Planctomycetaceae bacterium]